ncbi:MAG TPA: CHASE2 domain-containing protein [Chitinophagaceae bacterium]|nr:CHASE2 domain-containing protein [Chitinophagaceae bacterium]
MKPFHRAIGRRIKKYGSHFTKYLYERDTIFATIWVFAFIIFLGLIPINFYFLNPLKLALKDFDFNDITYAKLEKSKNTAMDSRIVVINIGHADREAIAMIIEKTASLSPKVMGLDVLFDEAQDPFPDSLLASTLEKYPNLVVAARLNWHIRDSLYLSRNHFRNNVAKLGYVNFDNEDLETTRLYSPIKKDSYHEYQSFSAALVREYDPAAYEYLKKRDKPTEIINYSRNYNLRSHQYHVIDALTLMAGNVEDSVIKGKIALFGYINLDPNDIEDKKFTPMNEKFAGKSVPDMNGIIVHANIISMILDKNYIKKLPSWVNWLVAILICWLHMSFFIRYYLENHIWFHLVAKIAQLVSAIFFAYIGMLLFEKYNIKLDMKMSLIVIVMAVDVIYFYEAFAVWVHKKFNYQTVFHQKHH